MKDVSSKGIRERISEGKRTSIAREAKVSRQQNGEVEPLRPTAKKQSGTDENRRS